jgi:hypothetical protein
MERRTEERQEVSLPVEIVDPNLGQAKLVTRDLSKGGAFIQLNGANPPPVGRVVSVRLPGLLWGEKLSTVSARVVWVTDEGMGLQFFDFDLDW